MKRRDKTEIRGMITKQALGVDSQEEEEPQMEMRLSVMEMTSFLQRKHGDTGEKQFWEKFQGNPGMEKPTWPSTAWSGGGLS